METGIPGSTAAAPQQPTNGATEAQNERVIAEGKSFAAVIQSSHLAAVTSPAARAFTETLIKESERLGMHVESVITGTVNAQVVYFPEDFGIALIFAGPQGLTKRPVSDKTEEVVNAFHQHPNCGQVRVITCYVVDETSYDYAEAMAAGVYNTIMTVRDEDSGMLNVNSFKINDRNVPLVVSTKPEAYREYVRMVSPFGFSERDDIGFLVGFPKPTCPNTERFNLTPETHIILFAVTAYTQFVRIENQTFGYNNLMNKTIRPVVHITGIVSQNPSMVLLPPAVTIAAKTFIAHRNWRRPYLAINGKELFNVGNLVINTDQNGNRTTMDVETSFHAEQAMDAACAEPILCLDITDGRYSIPGLNCILGSRDINGHEITLASILQRYYGNLVIPQAHGIQVLAGTPMVENTGSITLDNQVIDSRCGDYLRMFKKTGDYGQVCSLLSQPNDPSVRLQQLSDLGVPVKSLYKTTSVIFTRDCVRFLSDLCPNYDLDITSDARFNYTFNGIEQAAGIAELNLPTYGPSNGNIGGNMNGPFSRY